MTSHKKISLSAVAIIFITLLLIGLAISLSFVSIDSIKYLGKHSVELDEKNTRDNAKIFFQEITRRTAGQYSTYFKGVESFVDITATQLRKILLSPHNQVSTEIVQNYDLSKTKENFFYELKNQKEYSCFYFGPQKGLYKAEVQMEKLVEMSALIHTIYSLSPQYFVCLWLQTRNKLYLEYPQYSAYAKVEEKALKEYFDDFDTEYETVSKTSHPNFIFTKPYKDITGEVCLDVYKYIYTDDGEFLAAIGIDLDIEHILNTILKNSLFTTLDQNPHLSQNSGNIMEGFIFLVDENGSIIAFPEEYSALLELPKIEYSRLQVYPDMLEINLNESHNANIRKLGKELSSNFRGIKNFNLGNDEYIIAYNRIHGTGWVLCFATKEISLMESVIQTKQTVTKTEYSMIKKSIYISLIFLILSIIIAVLFFRFFLLKPLYHIREKVKEIGAGDFEVSLPETGFIEISELSITFNGLSKELKTYTENLAKEVKQRQSIETELEIAGKLQDSVLPKITDDFINDKYELYSKLIPAKEMSGDFYDYFYIKENVLCAVLADVCGKGITAAFYMSMAKAIIKEESLKATDLDTGKVVERINNTLQNSVNDQPMFLTMYLIFYEIDTGKITYTNAGHHEYILLDKQGKVSFHGEAHNIFAGSFGNIEYQYSEYTLKPGEAIILYTDGVTEAFNQNSIMYGNERLKNTLEKLSKNPISEIIDKTIENIQTFQADDRADDITFIMLRRNS